MDSRLSAWVLRPSRPGSRPDNGVQRRASLAGLLNVRDPAAAAEFLGFSPDADGWWRRQDLAWLTLPEEHKDKLRAKYGGANPLAGGESVEPKLKGAARANDLRDGTFDRYIKELSALGLIEKKRDPDGSRSTLIRYKRAPSITPRSRQVVRLYDGLNIRVAGTNQTFGKSVLAHGASRKNPPNMSKGEYTLAPPEAQREKHNGAKMENVLSLRSMHSAGDGAPVRLATLKAAVKTLTEGLSAGPLRLVVSGFEVALDSSWGSAAAVERALEYADALIRTRLENRYPYACEPFPQPYFEYRPRPWVAVIEGEREHLAVKLDKGEVKRAPRARLPAHCNERLKLYPKTWARGGNILRLEYSWASGNGEKGNVKPLVVEGFLRRQKDALFPCGPPDQGLGNTALWTLLDEAIERYSAEAVGELGDILADVMKGETGDRNAPPPDTTGEESADG